MKKINQFQAHERIKQPLLLDQVTSGNTKDGSLFLSVSLKDATGTIDGKFWNATAEQLALFTSLIGKVVIVDAIVTEFKGNNQLKIADMIVAELQDVDKFIEIAPIETRVMQDELERFIFMIDDAPLQRVVRKMINDNLSSFTSYPAASKNHHEYYSGLLHHVTSMLKLAEKMVELYPQLNASLLYAGIIIHDIGKIVELSGPVGTVYTLEGKLLGHISIALKMLEKAKNELQIETTENILLLEHLLLAHHGKMEFGSPKEPVVMEAEVLNLIDNFDARMVMMTRALANTKSGEFTTRIFSLENRSFYKPLSYTFDTEISK